MYLRERERMRDRERERERDRERERERERERTMKNHEFGWEQGVVYGMACGEEREEETSAIIL
jgi:hypothetical protein